MIRAVPDTNVWVGAILWRGAAYQVRSHAEAGNYMAVSSNPILHELVRVLRTYFDFPDELAFGWWLHLSQLCDVIHTSAMVNVVRRDPDDNKFIECAVDGRCEYVVSKDLDLLDIEQYQTVRMITVGAFLGILETET